MVATPQSLANRIEEFRRVYGRHACLDVPIMPFELDLIVAALRSVSGHRCDHCGRRLPLSVPMRGEADEPDPRCCLGLSPIECAGVPGRHCDGLKKDGCGND